MKNVLLFLLVLALILAIVARVRYGGGEAYDDLTGAPVIDASLLEEVLAYPEPIGNVAVSSTGRIFFTVHPEARPTGNKLLEFVDGAAMPFPSIQQAGGTVRYAVRRVAIDRFDRLWTIDHGNHGLRSARIVGIDLATGEVIRQHVAARQYRAGRFFPAGPAGQRRRAHDRHRRRELLAQAVRPSSSTTWKPATHDASSSRTGASHAEQLHHPQRQVAR